MLRERWTCSPAYAVVDGVAVDWGCPPVVAQGRTTSPPPCDWRGIGVAGLAGAGEPPDREIAFGAVGKFWLPVIEWRDVIPEDFSGFTEPGWGKIAANFSVMRYGEHSTLLSYQCRTVTTDPESQRRFMRYWWLIRPFVGHIMRATVSKIKADAEAGDGTEMMRVLVIFGSKRGGTAGLADMIGDALDGGRLRSCRVPRRRCPRLRWRGRGDRGRRPVRQPLAPRRSAVCPTQCGGASRAAGVTGQHRPPGRLC